MVLGGLWHGAQLNFLLWGLWHGLALAIAHLWHRSQLFGGRLPRPVSWAMTMVVVFYGWMLFRASSVDDLWNWHAVLFSDWSWPVWGNNYLLQVTVLILPLLIVEFVASRLPQRHHNSIPNKVARVVAESLLLLGVIVCWTDDPPEFIYFQF
jgi:alginate O-acetyltransferase complex protein AlgI